MYLNKLEQKIYTLTERTGLKLALFLIASMTTLSGSIIAPALPAIAEKFHTTPHIDILAPLVMSLPALFVTLTAPLAGVLMDKFGRLRLLYGGMLAWSAAGVAGAWCENLYVLLAVRALFGVATAFVMNGANVLVADYFSIGGRREAALSAQNAVMAFMGVSMSIAVGGLAGVSSEACFLVYGVGVVIWAMSLPYLFEPRRRDRGHLALNDKSARLQPARPCRTPQIPSSQTLEYQKIECQKIECQKLPLDFRLESHALDSKPTLESALSLIASKPKQATQTTSSTTDSKSLLGSSPKASYAILESSTLDSKPIMESNLDSTAQALPLAQSDSKPCHRATSHKKLDSKMMSESLKSKGLLAKTKRAKSRERAYARDFWRLCGVIAMGIFVCVIFYVCPTQMPFVLKHTLGLHPTALGALLSLPALHYGLISLFYKRIHAWLGIAWVFVWASLLDSAGFALLASSHHLGLIVLAFALIGCGSGLLSINTSSWLFSFALESVRARYFGYLAGAIFLGQFLSPLLSQPLVRLVGVEATLWVCAAACACVGIIWVCVRGRARG